MQRALVRQALMRDEIRGNHAAIRALTISRLKFILAIIALNAGDCPGSMFISTRLILTHLRLRFSLSPISTSFRPDRARRHSASSSYGSHSLPFDMV